MYPSAQKVPVKNRNVKASDSPFTQFQNLDRAAEIAYYYGFMPIKPPVIDKEDISLGRKVAESESHNRNYSKNLECPLCVNIEEKIALLRFCERRNLLSAAQPALIYFEGESRRFDVKRNPTSAYKRINLDVIGTNKSVAEAELIKVALEILREEGFEDLYVDINSIGDRDSLARFLRELNGHFRKHANDLQSHCRAQLKKDVFAMLECDNKKCQEISESAPKSIAYLSEQSRMHFKEVLEYLESMNVPYKIDHRLVGHRKICCHTTFLIKALNVGKSDDEPEETLAFGFRYNGLSKKIEMKKEIPAVGLTLAFKRNRSKDKKSHIPKKPKVYFIQFGFEAKLKSLQVIETLRQAKIPLYQALAKDKLTSQIATAENLGIPFVLIMGQREAIEGSVIVRNMSTRFQETVKISDLAEYLKKLSR